MGLDYGQLTSSVKSQSHFPLDGCTLSGLARSQKVVLMTKRYALIWRFRRRLCCTGLQNQSFVFFLSFVPGSLSREGRPGGMVCAGDPQRVAVRG